MSTSKRRETFMYINSFNNLAMWNRNKRYFFLQNYAITIFLYIFPAFKHIFMSFRCYQFLLNICMVLMCIKTY